MRGLEETCVRLVVHVASHEINRFLTQIKAWDFVPRAQPTAATSPLVEELIIYLQVRSAGAFLRGMRFLSRGSMTLAGSKCRAPRQIPPSRQS